MEDFSRAKEGSEHTFALLSPFSPCEGGARRGDDGDIIMIIFYVLAYKPTPLLRVSAPTGKITHKALQQDCKIFFGIFKNVKKF